VVFVFDFSLGKGCRIADAPINRLASAIDVAFLHEIQESVGDRGFIVEAHRQIRIVPAAENAQALEIFLVLFDVTRRKFATQLSELRRRNFAFAAQFLFHLCFDRQAVAIPAGNVRRVVASHALRLDDQVFQNFVQAGAEVNRPGRIGRPVVKHK
jgi:hypothetical protein